MTGFCQPRMRISWEGHITRSVFALDLGLDCLVLVKRSDYQCRVRFDFGWWSLSFSMPVLLTCSTKVSSRRPVGDRRWDERTCCSETVATRLE